jgi:hypothetical protein
MNVKHPHPQQPFGLGPLGGIGNGPLGGISHTSLKTRLWEIPTYTLIIR